jgi:aspartyl-tRNA(Asn)/glutamyl-tRNA(Gln) amidotransferase subunit A
MSMASSLDTIGALTKTVEDAAIVLQAMAGSDPLDATTGNVPLPDYHAELRKPIKGLRIGLPKEYFTEGIDPEVEAAVRAAAKTFEGLGAHIEEISLPHTKYGCPTYYVLCPSEVSSNMARYDGIRYGHTPLRQGSAGQAVENAAGLTDYYERVRSEGFGAEVKRRIMIGTYALSAGYFEAYYRCAQKVRTLVKRDFEEAFTKVDLLFAPVSPTPAFKVAEKTADPVQMYLADIFTIPASLAGVPGLSLPCGFTQQNLPIGMQLIGPHFKEEVILRAGHAFEKATDWHTRKPSL